MSDVPRIGRVLDVIGLLIFLAGGGLFARSWAGFRSVPDFQRAPGDVPMAAVAHADGFLRLQHIGVGLMLIGVGVFGLAWWMARRAGS